MGRTKNSPQRRDISLSTIGEFIPVIRKRRSKWKGRNSVDSLILNLSKKDHEQYFLGALKIGITNNVFPDKFSTCRLSFKSPDDDFDENETLADIKKAKEFAQEKADNIVLEFDETVLVVMKSLIDILFLEELVQLKSAFSLNIYEAEEQVFIKIYLTSLPLPKFNSKTAKCLKTLFNLLYDVESMNSETNLSKISQSNSELNELYSEIVEERPQLDSSLKERDIRSPFLKPELRPYQEDAVRWMIYRETAADDITGDIHPLYDKIRLQSDTVVYFNKHTGWVEKNPPLVTGSWKGGILADEMGLGKTLEVLACILTNPKEKFEEHDSLVSVSRRRKSSSDAEILSLNEGLVVKTQSKINKLKKRKIEDDQDYCGDKKKRRVSGDSTVEPSKVEESPVKSKPAYKIALEQFYKESLKEFCTTLKKEPPTNNKVQCICGDVSKRGLTVECSVCGKYQHAACLGFKSGKMGPYICPQCWMEEPPLESGATLIVAPPALHKQWCREIERHLKPGINVLKYEGFTTATPVYPMELKSYDIVVTTYAVLAAELKLTETAQSFNLRHQRKYWPGGSPLVRVKWWRLCLDEAQTVETPGKMVSEMAQKIPAVYRWAVTGTPMSKGVSDIYGLVDYLQMSPYNEWDAWYNILYQPFLLGNKTPMLKFLGKVLWRTSKDSVINQINIPKQSYIEHLLEFSAVEKFFYNREHELSARDFLAIAKKFEPSLLLDKMHRSHLKNLMGPLLSLRQACSDPSSVRGKGRYLALKKNASSMKDLLDALLLKNKTDCEESLRLMISSINGLAGICLLMKNYDEAISQYRKVLQIAASHEDDSEKKLSIGLFCFSYLFFGRFLERQAKLKMAEYRVIQMRHLWMNEALDLNKLLLIHAMHNLADIFDKYPPREPTLRDGFLRRDCTELVKQYIEKFMKESASARDSWLTFKTNIESLQEEYMLKDGQWFSDAFEWVTDLNLENDLINRAELAAANANIPCNLRMEAHTSQALLYKTYSWRQEIEDKRNSLIDAVECLYSIDQENGETRIVVDDTLVAQAMNCHLRPEKKSKNSKVAQCDVCKANEKLKEYEGRLFHMKKRKQNFEEMSLEGSWKSTLEELILRSLLTLCKFKKGPEEYVYDGEIDVQLFDVYKKEFKEIRRFWTQLDQQVCANDEVNICKVTMQLKTDSDNSKTTVNRVLKSLSYEQTIAHENINLIRVEELEQHEWTLRSEETNHSAKLKDLLGTRNYLTTLRSQQFEGGNPDPCPVCKGVMEKNWVILPCGHCYCLECFQRLIEKPPVKCSVCRAEPDLQEVAYIKAGGATSAVCDDNQEGADEIQVVGSYSRKIEAVVRLLLRLRRQDPLVKVLLFSSWSIVLKLLKTALLKNDVNVELGGSTGFEKKIESFKNPDKKITVLLMPINLGSKGLNLVEATHVILLEPVLNPADELQAIGRVHRIGQTKPTTVHKFLVRNTIEESLHDATRSNASKWEKNQLTIGQLQELFSSTNVQTLPSEHEEPPPSTTTRELLNHETGSLELDTSAQDLQNEEEEPLFDSTEPLSDRLTTQKLSDSETGLLFSSTSYDPPYGEEELLSDSTVSYDSPNEEEINSHLGDSVDCSGTTC